MRYKILFKLVIADLIFDKKVSFFIISSLVAVIAPLLLLFSLKFGIVSQLQTQLLENPQNLEIKIVGKPQSTLLNQQWFDALNQQPEIKFSIPLARSLNMLADVRKDNNHFINSIELIPTQAGDPLIPEQRLQQKNGAFLTATAAEKLGVKSGQKIQLFFGRKYQGTEQKEQVELLVEGIVEERYFARNAIFLSLPLIMEIENYRDGFQVQDYVAKPTDGAPLVERNDFASARIYAADLDSVINVAQQLRQQGIETRTQANEIANVKAINKVLSILFLIIAVTSIVGVVLSLSGSFLSNIERKRKEISLLSLFGLVPSEIKLYLIIQAFLLSSLAFASACALYFLGNLTINHLLGENLSSQHFISQLLPVHFISAFVATLIISCVIALFGANQAVKIQPSEVLREI